MITASSRQCTSSSKNDPGDEVSGYQILVLSQCIKTHDLVRCSLHWITSFVEDVQVRTALIKLDIVLYLRNI
jgi:hypothetical protein